MTTSRSYNVAKSFEVRTAIWATALLCSWATSAIGAECSVKIGRVLPMTGALQPAALVHPWIDAFKIDQFNKKGGLVIGGRRCDIEIKYYDSKSTPAGSNEAATKAIVEDKVNIVMASFTPDTTNQPTEMCEKYEIPCITTSTPIEAWLLGADGKPRDTEYGFHFFFQVADLIRNHVNTLKAIPGGFNGKIGYLYPNDPDGVVFYTLFNPAYTQEKWQGVFTGHMEEGLADYSPIVAKFKEAGVEVVAGVLPPPDLANFLTAAGKANFKPKFYMIDKASGFAEAMAEIGKDAEDIAGCDFWSEAFSGRSKYGDYDGAALIKTYETANPGKYYSPLLGLNDAAYDVLFSALERAGSADPAALIKALKATAVETVAGKIAFNEHNFSVIPLGTGQWRLDGQSRRWVKETVYSDFPSIAKSGSLRLYHER
ncbi:ABC transporter substrate-binding protein [Azospirillaceae bacterium]